jgi:type I restriction enzyme S subunit
VSEWHEVTLADLTLTESGIKSGPFGTMLSASEYVRRGVPVISVGEIGYGEFRLRESTPRVGEEVTSRLREYVLREGDIVFGRKGAVDRSAWVSAKEEGWFLGSDGLRARMVPGVDSRFIAFQMRDLRTRDWLLRHAGGSTLLSLNQGTLGRVPLLLPTLREQQAIAEVLGALDDKIAANTKLAVTADELSGQIYDASVYDWCRIPMSRLLNPILGGTPSRAKDEFWNPATDLWISARDITSAPSRVVLDTTEKISSLATAVTKAKPLPVGSVIFTARGTVGAVARLARPAAFNQSCYGFVPDLVPAEVLFYSILRASEQAQKIAHGSVFDTITKSTFDHLEMAWDPDAAPVLSKKLAPLLRRIDSVLEENRTLAATRDALLPQLMSGKLRVRDAEKLASEAGA